MDELNGLNRPELLIIYDYHPKEVFATKIGEYLEENSFLSSVRVVKYSDRPDVKKSNYYLRRFAVSFNPIISPIVLHGDDNHFDAALIYKSKLKKISRRAQNSLLDFCFSQYEEKNLLVCYGKFTDINTKCSIIDIELNEKMGFEAAIDLVKCFSRYLIDLYKKKIVL
jgi:hypothetical protein